MIKNINKLIDDMPFIIKLILGIIMTGIITLCFHNWSSTSKCSKYRL